MIAIEGLEKLTEAQLADVRAHVRGLTEENDRYLEEFGVRAGWRCFHCGERFLTVAGARLHFGASPDFRPPCLEVA